MCAVECLYNFCFSLLASKKRYVSSEMSVYCIDIVPTLLVTWHIKTAPAESGSIDTQMLFLSTFCVLTGNSSKMKTSKENFCQVSPIPIYLRVQRLECNRNVFRNLITFHCVFANRYLEQASSSYKATQFNKQIR